MKTTCAISWWAAVQERLFWTFKWTYHLFFQQHSCSLFPTAEYKSNTPATETFIFSKDKKFYFNDCIGDTAYYKDIVIILCTSQSPFCVTSDKRNALCDEILEEQKMLHNTPCIYLFFLGDSMSKFWAFTKQGPRKQTQQVFFTIQFCSLCVYVLKKYAVTILKVSSSQ